MKCHKFFHVIIHVHAHMGICIYVYTYAAGMYAFSHDLYIYVYIWAPTQLSWFLQDETWWPAQGRDKQDQRLHIAYANFRQWCKLHRVPQHGMNQYTRVGMAVIPSRCVLYIERILPPGTANRSFAQNS